MMDLSTSIAVTAGALLLLRRHRPQRLTVAEFIAGCESDVPPPQQWPRYVRAGFERMSKYLEVVESVIGRVEILGGWRPGPCNDAREGAERSRHLAGWALDLDLSSEQERAFRRFLVETGAITQSGTPIYRDGRNAWGDLVRRRTGWRGKVGLRQYASGSLHIDLGCPPDAVSLCDPRRSDWVEVLYG